MVVGRGMRGRSSVFGIIYRRRVAETKLQGWVYFAEIPPLVSRNLTARLWRVKFVPDRALLALLKEGFGHKVFEAALVRQVGSRMTSICKVPRDKTGRYLQRKDDTGARLRKLASRPEARDHNAVYYNVSVLSVR